MLVHVDLKINPIELTQTREVINEDEAKEKPESRFSKVNKFITRAVNYYADEEFQKSGFPLRWVD